MRIPVPLAHPRRVETLQKGGGEHKDPRQFLYDCLPIIAEYQKKEGGTRGGLPDSEACPREDGRGAAVAPERRGPRGILPGSIVNCRGFGHYAPHRVSIARPRFLFTGGCFYRAVIVSGATWAQVRTPPPHQPVAHYNNIDPPARIIFRFESPDLNRFLVRVAHSNRFSVWSPDSNRCSVRVARLESCLDSAPLTRIVFRFEPTDLIRFSIRVAQVESL